MGTLKAVADTLPDNDRFLPRYLTVQLLEILGKTYTTTQTSNTEYNAAAQAFIKAHQDSELFNQLTYSIFWRENAAQVLQDYTQPLDELDQYGRSALTVALANEDFVLANQIIEKGANVFLEDKLVLEIALISMMQRDSTTVSKILAQAPKDANWAKDYLEYLNSYAMATDKAESKPRKYREVLNPIIRHFGQVLDTMVYFNGTPSHYGFISPSLDVLTKHLKEYVAELKTSNEKNMFSQISDAFDFSQRISKFHGNLPATNAAEAIVQQIQTNISKNNKDVVIVFGGWAGNSVVIAFVNQYLILSNLGMGGDPQRGTTVYSIKNKDSINTTAIATFMCGLGDASDPKSVLAVIADIVDPNPLVSINQFLTPIDNCIFVNPRAVIQGILLVLQAFQKNTSINKENLAELSPTVANMYQAYVNSLYQHSTDDLAAFMRNHKLLQNKRIECCSLALEYINQHYNEPESIRRCIDLKNALEFVGLRDYYNLHITAEAKAAIQENMIHEQEATAIKVIEQEYALQAKQ